MRSAVVYGARRSEVGQVMDVTSERLLPRAELWEWQTRARCRGQDSAVFFGDENEERGVWRRRIRHAKTICADCPVIHECRTHALSVGEPFGVWGGMSPSERSIAPRRKPTQDNPTQVNPI